MGIPYYFYTLYKKYAGPGHNVKLMIDEHELGNTDIQHLFFDYNSLLHPCAHQAIASTQPEEDVEQAIINNVLVYTRYTIHLLKPAHVHIMIDGVAPRAKINQQRERRYKSWYFKRYQTLPDEQDNVTIDWDSNKITPGTAFMRKVSDALSAFANDIQESMPFIKSVVISDANECGEGEHKMMKAFKNLPLDGKICIYGLDADLIMLSLLNPRANDIILVRDNTFNTKAKESERTFTYLDIKQLKVAICKEMRVLYEKNVKHECQLSDLSIIRDYITISFLLGNDFVEHVPSLLIKENGMNVVMNAYIKTIGQYKKSLTIHPGNVGENSRHVDLRMLRDILMDVGRSEEYFFQKVYSVYKRSVYKDIPLVSTETLHFFDKDSVMFNQPGFRERYYLYNNISNVDQACLEYIEGLYWILGYYHEHEHNNWTWYYRHHATPFAHDISNFLSRYMDYTVQYIDCSPHLRASEPCSSLHQLMMVLPRESLMNILGEDTSNSRVCDKLKRLFKTPSATVERSYPTMLCIDMMHKEYMWQAKLLNDMFDDNIISLIE